MASLRTPGDAIAGVVLWSLAALVWWQSTTWPASTEVAGNPVILPRAFAGIMALVGLVLILRRRPLPEEAEESGDHRPLHALFAIGATAVLGVLLEPLGLIPAGILYVLVLQRMVGAPWRTAVPFAVATPVAIWLVFATALHVPLPSGQLWSAIYP